MNDRSDTIVSSASTPGRMRPNGSFGNPARLPVLARLLPAIVMMTALACDRSGSSVAAEVADGGTTAAAQPAKEPPPSIDGEGFVPLFDGKTLDGWRRVNGTANYHVEDGCIVGVCDPASKANTFLRTEATYRDFILALDVRFDVPGNSGIQFRSEQKDGDGRVFGYQCEIDNRTDRRWSGGIYDEARRGWLNDLKNETDADAREAFRMDDWNTFIIQARGRRLQTWINGVPCADYTDNDDPHFTPEGFIALQVHVGKRGTIRWRNIRIKTLDTDEPAAGATAIETVYIVPMSHIDIGFTAPPLDVADGAARHTQQALELARKDPEYVWNFEVFWELEQWLRPRQRPGFPPAASPATRPAPAAPAVEKLLQLVRQGRFGIGAAYVNPHSSLMSAWALDQLFRVPTEWAREQGLTLNWATINDVPGHPADLPRFAAANGVRYLLLGTNQGLSKPLPEEVCNTPFWWEAPDGSRVLAWIAGKNAYTEAFIEYGIDPGTARWFNRQEFTQTEPLEVIRHGMQRLENDYARKSYPYDAVVLMHAFDNWDAGAAARLPDAVRLWNESVGKPRLVLSTPDHFFRHIEKNYGTRLPVRRGGFGGQWELVRLGAPSAMARARAREAQLLAASGQPAPDDIRRLLVYWEHTFSLSTPWPGHLTREQAIQQTRQQWQVVADWPLPERPAKTGEAVTLPDSEPAGALEHNGVCMAASAFITWKDFFPVPEEAWIERRTERLDDGTLRCRHRIDRHKLPDPAHLIWAWKLSEKESTAPIVVQTAAGSARWPEDNLGGYHPFHWVAPWGFQIGSTRFTPQGAFAFARPPEHPGWLLCHFLSQGRTATFKGGQKAQMTFEEVFQGEDPIHEFIIDIRPVQR